MINSHHYLNKAIQLIMDFMNLRITSFESTRLIQFTLHLNFKICHPKPLYRKEIVRKSLN